MNIINKKTVIGVEVLVCFEMPINMEGWRTTYNSILNRQLSYNLNIISTKYEGRVGPPYLVRSKKISYKQFSLMFLH
jgi:hypothetical protein